ncbi:helix-turn-helix protein [Pseudomonas sp. LAIL14HWK12:I2]|uniref:helix-turn-helix domain-containing protein n=1 Tax=Pseudomonas sp. LAIL14HWK12:I2 TaxID=1265482 RepID=UPI0010682898|nr:helix-turn-helix transcriptional regulator [Pseudomonas sp. LAIL14HWK12:I2]TFA85204.1 helix-turn-helix protein [Pseudomonas sp. LAIL14HWK12:I2]
MDLNIAFGQALRKIRASKNLTQEDFSTVSSRTYLSSLERGLKSPTLEKINQLAGTLDVHPLTILVATYVARDANLGIEGLFHTIKDELAGMSSFQDLSQ